MFCCKLDYNPQMDGYEATRLIRKWEVDECEQCRALEKIEYDYEEIKECLHHRIPIVAVTADVMKGTHEMCFSAGMDDYIPKVCVYKACPSVRFRHSLILTEHTILLCFLFCQIQKLPPLRSFGCIVVVVSAP